MYIYNIYILKTVGGGGGVLLKVAIGRLYIYLVRTPPNSVWGVLLLLQKLFFLSFFLPDPCWQL